MIGRRVSVAVAGLSVLAATVTLVRSGSDNPGVDHRDSDHTMISASQSGSQKERPHRGVADLHSWKPKDYFLTPALLQACDSISRHDLSSLKAQIDSGLDVNSVGTNGLTLLHWAFACANIEAFQLLLESGADPDIRLKKGVKSRDTVVFHTGDSILHTSARAEYYRDYLMAGLRYCQNPDPPGAGGDTLFDLVVFNLGGRADELRELFRIGVNPNSSGRNYSAYASALFMKDCELIRVLREFGVDPCAKERSDSRTLESVDQLLLEFGQRNATDEIEVLLDLKAALLKCGESVK
jgi:ankyrin repeat protein